MRLTAFLGPLLLVLLLCSKPLFMSAAPVASNPNAIASDAAFFSLLDLTRPDLAAVRQAVIAHDWAGARQAWARHLETRTAPHWLWSRQDKAQITRVEDAQFGGLKTYLPAGDNVLKRTFAQPEFLKYPAREVVWHEGPNEWTTALNRLAFWPSLGRAYWANGDPKYADDFVFVLNDWVTANPVPPDARATGHAWNSGWRTLDTGLRIISWAETMPYFMDAPQFDANAKYQMTRSFAEQARYLAQAETGYAGGNWQVSECTGLAIVGIMFPEFKAAPAWRTAAFKYLVEHMQKDVEPDGMHWEMTPGYHKIVMRNYVTVSRLCTLNGYVVPGLIDRHEKMFEAIMKLSFPDRHDPPLGDAGREDMSTAMGEGALLYHRSDMRYLAPDKPAEGWVWQFGPGVVDDYAKLSKQTPAFTSVLLPDAQYAMMRTGWSAGDNYLLFDCAPFHGGHNHRDALQVIAYAGRDLLIDPGKYSYNGSLTGKFRTTEGHNVLTIDNLPQPAANPSLLAWDTTPGVDFASGSLAENGVTHQRSVVFVKPGCWVVVDTVTGTGVHDLTRLFHMPLGSAPQADATSVRTAFASGMNIHLLNVDGPGAPTHLEMRTFPIPTGSMTAEPGAVAAFVTHATLPVTLCAVLTPFADAHALPTKAERLPTRDPRYLHLRLTYANGQKDEIMVAPDPAPLPLAGKTVTGRALVMRAGPIAAAPIALGTHPLTRVP